jgi:hypothetical protein
MSLLPYITNGYTVILLMQCLYIKNLYTLRLCLVVEIVIHIQVYLALILNWYYPLIMSRIRNTEVEFINPIVELTKTQVYYFLHSVYLLFVTIIIAIASIYNHISPLYTVIIYVAVPPCLILILIIVKSLMLCFKLLHQKKIHTILG